MFKIDDQNSNNNSSVMLLLESMSSNVVNAEIPGRAPNASIIYRKVYVETARENGHYLPMTIVSSMASQSWESADETVKAEYRRIVKEALRVLNEIGDIKIKNLNTKSIKEIINNKNIEPRDTKPVIFVASSHNIISTLDLSFKMYSNTTPVFTNNPSNLDSSIISSMESQSWESADEIVKAEYCRMAKEALGAEDTDIKTFDIDGVFIDV
ncbi:16822_t:CDS:2 [Dentiscutata erythropus]|uniref:16822_t:CDS:1 n=1 Tax=Dentiscutata erythropus TaxID=1348616 RepID=A0A9N9DK41_9GLOM|nr:16822_t:CDS:2 [Dentiscutata erythropus]